MRKKIQNSMFMVVAASLLVAYAITILFMYGKIREITEKNIRQQAVYIGAAINISGESYLSRLDKAWPGTRVTLISQDGKVLYDTDEGEYSFENHKDRPEVEQALRGGEGSDIRHSATIGEDMLYYAVRLDDGNVIRVAQTLSTVWKTAMQFMPVMLGIVAVMMAAAYFIAKQQSRRLVQPINRLNLDEPLQNDIYEELQPLLRRIDEQNRQKDAVANMRKEFSANVSHELKTPLTSISGYAEIMRDGLVKPEDMQKFANRIYNEAERLIHLVNDIIKLSKLDEGEISAQKEEVNLFALSREICDRLQQTARKNDVGLTLSGENCVVSGIGQLLQEMIYNLVENAIKYNRKGGKVSVWTGNTIEGVCVRVTDTGIGIAPADQERIFERFYRVDKSHSKETGGTGLGLSIVKHGAMIHGAKVRVKSELGKGTTMEILFPRAEG